MGVKRYSRNVTKSKQWQAIRLEALRRDNWQCVKCKRRGKLEVDHIVSVRDDPAKSFDLSNLQSLCSSCHTKKTRDEIGFVPDPEKEKWKIAVKNLSH